MSFFFPSTNQQSSISQSSSFPHFSWDSENGSLSFPMAQNLIGRSDFQSPNSQASNSLATPPSWARSSSVVNTSQFCDSSRSFPKPPSLSLASSKTAIVPGSESQSSLPFFQQAERTHEIGIGIFTPRGSSSSSLFGLRQNLQTFPSVAPSAYSFSSSTPRKKISISNNEYFQSLINEAKNHPYEILDRDVVLYIFYKFITDFAKENLTNNEEQVDVLINRIQHFIIQSIDLAFKTIVDCERKENKYLSDGEKTDLLNKLRKRLKTSEIENLSDDNPIKIAIRQYLQYNAPPPSANESRFSLNQDNLNSSELSSSLFQGQIGLPSASSNSALTQPFTFHANENSYDFASESIPISEPLDSDDQPDTYGASSSSGHLPSQNKKRKRRPAMVDERKENDSNKKSATSSTYASKKKNIEAPFVSISHSAYEEEIPPELIINNPFSPAYPFQCFLLDEIKSKQKEIINWDQEIRDKANKTDTLAKKINKKIVNTLKKTKLLIKKETIKFINQIFYAHQKSDEDGIKSIKLAGHYYNWLSKNQLNSLNKKLFLSIFNEDGMKNKLINIFNENQIEELMQHFTDTEAKIVQEMMARKPFTKRRIKTNTTRNYSYTQKIIPPKKASQKIIPAMRASKIPPLFVPFSEISNNLLNSSKKLHDLTKNVFTKKSNLNVISQLMVDIRAEVKEVIKGLKRSPPLDDDLIGYINYARNIYNFCYQFQNNEIIFNEFLSKTSLVKRGIYGKLVEDSDE